MTANESDKILDQTRVLCVDDSPEALALLRSILTRHGAEVTTCSSAEEAIALLKNVHFDVLVSDISMPPGLDGYDLAHYLREMEDQDAHRDVIPSVAVSGDALRPSPKRRFADFQVYLPKPVDRARLVNVVANLTEADGEAVRLGSLTNWQASQATSAGEVAAEDHHLTDVTKNHRADSAAKIRATDPNSKTL